MTVTGGIHDAVAALPQPVPSRPIVSLDAVSKSFPVRKTWYEILRHPLRREKTKVLDNISLRISEGEFFGLLGKNGAGKTTLFRILSTIVLPDSGNVSIDGADAIAAPHVIRRLVAPVIASERSLMWRLSAYENLRLYAVLHGVASKRLGSEIDRVLGVVSLRDTGTKMVGTFSSGMRQRLLIARALLARPRVLLLDEPTRSLDPISAREFRRFLRDTIVGEEGCTVLLATHDADDVWNLCDRVAVLDKGELLAVDRTAALRMRVGDEVYRLWVPSADQDRHATIAREAAFPILSTRAAPDEGWIECSIEIPGGSSRAAEYLARVTAMGIAVARFEKSTPDLAELIERVVSGRGIR